MKTTSLKGLCHPSQKKAVADERNPLAQHIYNSARCCDIMACTRRSFGENFEGGGDSGGNDVEELRGHCTWLSGA